MAGGGAVLNYAECVMYGLVNKLGHLLVDEVALLAGIGMDEEEEEAQSCEQATTVSAILEVLSETQNLLRLLPMEWAKEEEACDLAYSMEDSIDVFFFYVKNYSSGTDAAATVFESEMQAIAARIRSLSGCGGGSVERFTLAPFAIGYAGGAVYDLVVRLGKMLVDELALLSVSDDGAQSSGSGQGILVSAALAVLCEAQNLLKGHGDEAEYAAAEIATEMEDALETFFDSMRTAASSREERDSAMGVFVSQMQATVGCSGGGFTFSVDLFPWSSISLDLERRTASLVEMVAAAAACTRSLKTFCVMGSGMASEVRRRLEGEFDCTANVVRSDDLVQLLRSLLLQLTTATATATAQQPEEVLPAGIYSIKEHDLADMIQNYLHDKRYLIVIEDVWSVEAWESIRCTFPNNNQGSRVVLMTEDETVAETIGDGDMT